MSVHINLVPESGRKKRPSGFPLKGFQLPREVVIGLVGGLTVLLAAGHIFLQLLITIRFVQMHHYKAAVKKITAQKAEVDLVLQQLRKVQNNLKVIEGISKHRTIYWAPKINKISELITRGVWLEEIILEDKRLTLRGSAVSKSGAEMIEVNNFVSKLKNDKGFAADFSRLETGSLKNRKINNTPVADFTITAQVK